MPFGSAAVWGNSAVIANTQHPQASVWETVDISRRSRQSSAASKYVVWWTVIIQMLTAIQAMVLFTAPRFIGLWCVDLPDAMPPYEST